MCRFTLLAVWLTLLITPPLAAGPPLTVSSPNGQVRIEFNLRRTCDIEFGLPRAGDAAAVPHYRVLLGDKEIIGPSRLGIVLGDGTTLGRSSEIEGTDTRSHRESYTQFPGKRRHVVDHCTEAVVRLRETSGSKHKWELVLRAYDDGAAFRYRFRAQKGWDQLVIAQEETEFSVPADAKAFALPLNSFTTSYEKLYEVKPAGELSKDWLLALPLLLECSEGNYAAVTEANVNEYAGLYLKPAGSGKLTTRLSPLPKEPKFAVRTALPHASPWRVIMVADRVGRLIESDLVLNLSAPRAIKDIAWIKPGKTTFPWWNGFYEEKVAFKPGLNTATAKHYIDFCAEAGIPYHSLDGVGNTAWYGGPIVPYKGASPTKGVEGLDLPEVIKYAKSKGVRLRFWMHWKAAETHMEQAFPLYREWGIEGVMLDFMDRDDQEMNAFVRRAVKLAADNHLTVTLHGCPKPTGLERTYPNLLTNEGVMNLEFDKWDKVGCPPEHEVTVPFTRMLAGPLDFHQGSFRAVRPEAFKPRNDAPLVMGTPCRTLASYVVYQNHLSMVADYPTAYRGHPALPALVDIPSTWDDTRVLDGRPREYIVIARRSGANWYIGVMTDRKAREITIPLGFLGTGDYQAKVYADDLSAKHEMAIRSETVTAKSSITLNLVTAGGALIRLSR